MPDKKRKMNKEIKAVSRLRAQKLARNSMLLLFIPLLFVFHQTALYLAVLLLLFPPAMRYAILTASPQQDKEYLEHALLPETLRRYQFSRVGYRAEHICFIMTLLLLALWQWIQPEFSWHGLPLWRIPGILLIFYFCTVNILSVCFFLRIRHDFFHLNIS